MTAEFAQPSPEVTATRRSQRAATAAKGSGAEIAGVLGSWILSPSEAEREGAERGAEPVFAQLYAGGFAVTLTAMRSFITLLLLASTVFADLKTNIEFAKVGDVSLTLDANVPEGPGPFPTVILVHGGGWMRGDKQTFIKPLFAPMTKAGFTWFTINYRLAPAHRWPACADDVERAIRWVKANAKQFKADPKRIALVGESAGGHLVSYVGVRGAGDTSVAAVVPIYAPHDLESHAKGRNALGPSLSALFGLTELNDEAVKQLRAASATSYLRKGLPPFLQLHGTKDAQVDYAQSVKFQERMRALGNTCDFITIPDGAHGIGGWDKLVPDYAEQLTAWLRKTLN